MFSQEELQAILAEATEGSPMSVSTDPENVTDGQKKFLRALLVAAFKFAFTAVTKIPLPVQQTPGLVGAESLITSPDLPAMLLKPALSFLAQNYGDALVAAVLSQKDEVNRFVGDPVYDLGERILRELRGSQFSSF